MGASPSPDVPVRYTPITGRVSRAKKGVPVHICENCNPPKVRGPCREMNVDIRTVTLTKAIIDLHEGRTLEVRAADKPHWGSIY